MTDEYEQEIPFMKFTVLPNSATGGRVSVGNGTDHTLEITIRIIDGN